MEDAMVTAGTLARARAGDEQAFRELTDPYRGELLAHCYQILGSVADAEDMLQETLLAAWRGLTGFEGRSSVRAWLHRIAVNGCLNALRDRSRRPREVPMMAEPPQPTRMADPVWVEPYPDMLLDGLPDAAPGPEARYDTKEAVELAFISALQHLPPRQRAVLVLRDVLGYPAAEAAVMLEATEASVKGALQRARAALQARLPPCRPGCRPAATAPRRPAPPASGTWRAGSPPPSKPATSTPCSPCSPATPGSPCRPSRTSTRARRPSPPSCATAPPCAAPRCGWCPPGPTPSPPSAATCPAPTPRSPGPTG